MAALMVRPAVQTSALMKNDAPAPKAKPRDRKKAMMAPAVSASWGRTFLNEEKKKYQLRLLNPKQPVVFSSKIIASLIFWLWAEAHAQAGQVSVGEGEEQHETDEPGVVVEEDGEVEPRLNVA